MPTRWRVAALIASLPHASAEEADGLVAEMLDEPSGPAIDALLDAVLQRWGRLSEHARKAALACAGAGIIRHLADLTRSTDADSRWSAALVIEHIGGSGRWTSGDVNVLAMAAAALAGDQAPQVQHAARSALSVMASASSRLDSATEHAMDSALAAQLRIWEAHRHSALANAVARRASRATGELLDWLAHDGEPGHFALRSHARALAIEFAHEGRVLLPWLGVPALRGVAIDRVRAAAAAGRLSGIASSAHLLAVPSRSRAMRRVPSPTALVPPVSDATLCGSMAMRWIMSLPLRPRQQVRHLGDRLLDESENARLMAVRALSRLPASNEVDASLGDFALDRSEAVASAAAGCLADARSPSRQAVQRDRLRVLTRSPHQQVRLLAGRTLVSTDPWWVPPGEDRMWWRPLAARRALQASREEFLDQLRDRIRAGANDRRLDALTLAERLGLESELLAELRQFIGDVEPRIASKAAVLLGRTDPASAHAPLMLALAYADGRVRASAVSSLHRLQVETPRDLMLLEDPQSRVRACAAVKLAGKGSGARQTILDLLRDPIPHARSAGLWAVGKLGLTALLDQVDRLASSDHCGQVQRRATGVSQRLRMQLRAGWTETRGVSVTTRAVRPATREAVA